MLHRMLIALLLSVLCTATYAGPVPAKNIILMIGDGMGPQQVGLLELYARRGETSHYKNGHTALSTFSSEGRVGLSLHDPVDGLVVDSACSASQLATGVAARSETIGLDVNGDIALTILEAAKAEGKATGLISDMRISHATPAAFAAHQPHRSLENAIAAEMLRSNNVDVMLSGGLRHWLPANISSDKKTVAAMANLIDESSLSLRSRRQDNSNLLLEAKNSGYDLAFNRQQLQASTGNKLLGLFASSLMMDGIQYTKTKEDKNRIEPSLAEMTTKALDILAKNKKGFFLMVEGGQIDWAGHQNDAGTLLHELLKFDEAVAAVYTWVKDRNDTLVVITADHETGGFGFSYSRRNIPIPKKLPGAMFVDREYAPNFNFGSPSVLDKLYLQKASFSDMWVQARGDSRFPTVQSLRQAINTNSEFELTEQEVAVILQREVNEYQVEEHKYLSAAEFPAISDFKEFYVYGDVLHLNLIGRALAKYQNTVWSTGTHTHTPVSVVAWGNDTIVDEFSSILHHRDIGQILMRLITM